MDDTARGMEHQVCCVHTLEGMLVTPNEQTPSWACFTTQQCFNKGAAHIITGIRTHGI